MRKMKKLIVVLSMIAILFTGIIATSPVSVISQIGKIIGGAIISGPVAIGAGDCCFWILGCNYATFNLAVAATPAGRTLWINCPLTLTANIVVPNTIDLRVSEEGSIIQTGAFTLTINSRFEAPLKQAFAGFSAGQVTFGLDTVKEVYPQWWGAKGDGATDDTTAITNAVAAGSNIFFPVPLVDYYISAPIPITSGKNICGVPGKSKINQHTVGADTFQVNTTEKVTFNDLWLYKTVTATAGAAIRFNGSGGVQVNKPRVINCTFENQYDSIVVIAANQFQIWASDFLNEQHFAIDCYDPLSTDSEIIGCFINTGVSAALAGIIIEGCPGLRIASNKILGYKKGVHICLVFDTSSINITGNSIENQADAGIQIELSVAGKTIGSLAIVGNEFAQHPTGILVGANGNFLENCAIVGNTLANFTTGIWITGGYRYAIVGNQLAHGTNGIILTASTYVVTGGTNSIEDVTHPLTGTPVSGY